MYKCLILLFVFTLYSCGTNKLVRHGLVKINPLFDQPYVCAEHAIEEMGVGDAYGRDCMVTQFKKADNKNRKWQTMYASSGLQNSDWFSWRSNVLAPFDGKVVKVYINNKTNNPGLPVRSRASGIVFTSEDEINVVYAHIREPLVKEGDVVKKGQVVAKVGNNGNAWMPHIHIGAWKGDRPLQIIFDLVEWQKTIDKLFP